MSRLRFTALGLAILTLVGCAPAPTDPARAATDKPAAAQSRTPPSAAPPIERGGDGGSGY
jgi:hypothetical protein